MCSISQLVSRAEDATKSSVNLPLLCIVFRYNVFFFSFWPFAQRRSCSFLLIWLAAESLWGFSPSSLVRQAKLIRRHRPHVAPSARKQTSSVLRSNTQQWFEPQWPTSVWPRGQLHNPAPRWHVLHPPSLSSLFLSSEVATVRSSHKTPAVIPLQRITPMKKFVPLILFLGLGGGVFFVVILLLFFSEWSREEVGEEASRVHEEEEDREGHGDKHRHGQAQHFELKPDCRPKMASLLSMHLQVSLYTYIQNHISPTGLLQLWNETLHHVNFTHTTSRQHL